MKLENFTEEELRRELSRREEERAAALEVAKDEYASRMINLTKEMVDIIVPEHTRTSCSDTHVDNGWYCSGGTIPRCTRCALLDAVGGYWDRDFVLEVFIRDHG